MLFRSCLPAAGETTSPFPAYALLRRGPPLPRFHAAARTAGSALRRRRRSAELASTRSSAAATSIGCSIAATGAGVLFPSPPLLRWRRQSTAPWPGCSEPEWAPFRPLRAASACRCGAALCLLELGMEGLGCCRPTGSPTTRSAARFASRYRFLAYLVDGSLLRLVVSDSGAEMWTCWSGTNDSHRTQVLY